MVSFIQVFFQDAVGFFAQGLENLIPVDELNFFNEQICIEHLLSL